MENAKRIEKEIMASGTNDKHILEERGYCNDDIDEETK